MEFMNLAIALSRILVRLSGFALFKQQNREEKTTVKPCLPNVYQAD